MRALRWFFVIALILCLSPVISTGAAALAAHWAGCGLIGDEFFECTVRGRNITPMLVSLSSIEWLSIWGAVAAFFAALLWIVIEIVAMTIGRGARSLRF